MGQIHREYLDSESSSSGEEERILCCSSCGTHLSRADWVMSKSFHGHHGHAWLLAEVHNISHSDPSTRTMSTGLHEVCDIVCKGCSMVVGWQYIKAWEPSQTYKEGKFILERTLLREV